MPWLPGLTLAWVARAVVSSAWWRPLNLGGVGHFTPHGRKPEITIFRPDQIFFGCSKSGRNHKKTVPWNPFFNPGFDSELSEPTPYFSDFFWNLPISSADFFTATGRVRRSPGDRERLCASGGGNHFRGGGVQEGATRNFGESHKWVSFLGWIWIRFYGIKMDLRCFYLDWNWFNMIQYVFMGLKWI